MSDTTDRGGATVKTLAIRLDEAVHAQLSVIAQLRRTNITEEIRQAIEEHIKTVRSQPELMNSAETALDDIEREIAARKAAIAALFGQSEPATTPARKASRGSASEGQPSSEARKATRGMGFGPSR